MTPGAPAKAAAAIPGTTAARKLDRSLVEGPLAPAVWRLAWPTVLQNAIGGLQGIIAVSYTHLTLPTILRV